MSEQVVIENLGQIKPHNSSSSQPFGISNIEKAKAATVVITSFITKYIHNGGHKGNFIATGFIVDKEKGLLVTNSHVANTNLIQKMKIKFFDGKKVDARLVYNDPEHDFAIVNVSPEEIPEVCTELKFSSKAPVVGENVLMVGSNEGMEFTVQTGTVVDNYVAKGHFLSHSMLISLNSKGGSSGSAVCNEAGEVVGLNFAGSPTSAVSLQTPYVVNAVSRISEGESPIRNTLGMTFEYCNLYDAEKYASLRKDYIDEYLKNFPDSRSKAICVSRIFDNSPAKDKLHTLDIVWKVNNELVGPNLYKLHSLIDSSVNKTVGMELIRQGKNLSFSAIPHTLDTYKINKVLHIDNAFLYKVDQLTHHLRGAPFDDVFVSATPLTSSLRDLGLASVERISNTKISSLKDIVNMLPKLIEKEEILVHIKNYAPKLTYDSKHLTHQQEKAEVVQLDKNLPLQLLKLNDNSTEWEQINLESHLVCEENNTNCHWDEAMQSVLADWDLEG